MKVYKIGNKGCKECKVMVPRWKEIEQELPNLKTEYYEAAKNQELIEKYKIGHVPTFLFLDDQGNELSRMTGIVSKEKIKKEIEKLQ